MKITIKQKSLFDIIKQIKRCGYAEFKNWKINQTSFTHRLGPYLYPRFHIYIKEMNKKIELSLHLDQKKPSYQGCSAHSGEYEGELVEREAERIKNFIKKNGE